MTFAASHIHRSREFLIVFMNQQLQRWPFRHLGINDRIAEINRLARNLKKFEADKRTHLRAKLHALQSQLDAKLDRFIELARQKPEPSVDDKAKRAAKKTKRPTRVTKTALKKSKSRVRKAKRKTR